MTDDGEQEFTFDENVEIEFEDKPPRKTCLNCTHVEPICHTCSCAYRHFGQRCMNQRVPVFDRLRNISASMNGNEVECPEWMEKA